MKALVREDGLFEDGISTGRLYSIVIEFEDNKEILTVIQDGKKTTTMSLEKIDYMTSMFKNRGEFLTYLNKKCEFEAIPKKIYLEYKNNGEVKTADMIFDSQLIREASESIIKQKRAKKAKIINETITEEEKKKDIRIELDETMKGAIKRIVGSAFVRECFEDIVKRRSVFPTRLKQKLLKEQRIMFSRFTTPNEQYELTKLREELEYDLTNYSNFRRAFLWAIGYVAKQREDNQEYRQVTLEEVGMVQPEQPEGAEPAPRYIEKIENDLQINDASDSNIKDIRVEREELLMQYESLSTASKISNSRIREAYLAYDGDIDMIVEIYGEDYLEQLSDEDQILIGFDAYKQRQP